VRTFCKHSAEYILHLSRNIRSHAKGIEQKYSLTLDKYTTALSKHALSNIFGATGGEGPKAGATLWPRACGRR
jgi:hypothetical protein